MRNIGVSVGDIESDEQTGEEMETPEPEEGMDPMAPETAGPVTSAPGAPAGAAAPAGGLTA